MKNLIFIALALFMSAAYAERTYQVTGPVLEVSDKMIVVKKGSDRWELSRDASTKIKGEPKVGAKVTIEYTMSAKNVEVKK